jgi:hypothetical protein
MYHNWESPEIEEWEDSPREEYDNRQLIGFGFVCYPRHFTFPSQFCSPKQCSPTYVCFPQRYGHC